MTASNYLQSTNGEKTKSFQSNRLSNEWQKLQVHDHMTTIPKGQLILKGFIKVFTCSKKYFGISALAYKKRSNQKNSVIESK